MHYIQSSCLKRHLPTRLQDGIVIESVGDRVVVDNKASFKSRLYLPVMDNIVSEYDRRFDKVQCRVFVVYKPSTRPWAFCKFCSHQTICYRPIMLILLIWSMSYIKLGVWLNAWKLQNVEKSSLTNLRALSLLFPWRRGLSWTPQIE